MYACLAVTCHLHFWQNDRDFLRATVVTRGWNGYRNKSQHRKSTLEKKILPPFQQGFEPATFQSRVRRSNHWAIPAPVSWGCIWSVFIPADLLQTAQWVWSGVGCVTQSIYTRPHWTLTLWLLSVISFFSLICTCLSPHSCYEAWCIWPKDQNDGKDKSLWLRACQHGTQEDSASARGHHDPSGISWHVSKVWELWPLKWKKEMCVCVGEGGVCVERRCPVDVDVSKVGFCWCVSGRKIISMNKINRHKGVLQSFSNPVCYGSVFESRVKLTVSAHILYQQSILVMSSTRPVCMAEESNILSTKSNLPQTFFFHFFYILYVTRFEQKKFHSIV